MRYLSNMKNLNRLMGKSAMVALFALGLSACTSDDDVIVGNITISETELNKTVEWKVPSPSRLTISGLPA